MTPGRISGSSVGQRPVGDGAGGGDPLDLGRLLDRPVGLDPALDRDELDVRGGRREPPPDARARRSPASTADASRPDRRHQLGPAGRQVVVRPRRRAHRAPRAAPGSCSASRRGPTTSSAPTRNWPGVAGDLLLALAEGEAGQVAHVLAADAEVGVDAGVREPRPQAREPRRAGGTVGLGPAGVIGRRRAAPRSRPGVGRPVAVTGHGSRTSRRFSSCSSRVLGEGVRPVRSVGLGQEVDVACPPCRARARRRSRQGRRGDRAGDEARRLVRLVALQRLGRRPRPSSGTPRAAPRTCSSASRRTSSLSSSSVSIA